MSLLQLDDNLIEGEPYNRLAWKNKRQLNVARQNSNISEMWETGFKNPLRRAASVCMGPGPVSSTHSGMVVLSMGNIRNKTVIFPPGSSNGLFCWRAGAKDLRDSKLCFHRFKKWHAVLHQLLLKILRLIANKS